MMEFILPCTSELTYTVEVGPENGNGPTAAKAKEDAFERLGGYTAGRTAAMEMAKKQTKCQGDDCIVDANATSIEPVKAVAQKIGDTYFYQAKYSVGMKVKCKKKPALLLASFSNLTTIRKSLTDVVEVLASLDLETTDNKLFSTDIIDTTKTLTKEVQVLQGKVESLAGSAANLTT